MSVFRMARWSAARRSWSFGKEHRRNGDVKWWQTPVERQRLFVHGWFRLGYPMHDVWTSTVPAHKWARDGEAHIVYENTCALRETSLLQAKLPPDMCTGEEACVLDLSAPELLAVPKVWDDLDRRPPHAIGDVFRVSPNAMRSYMDLVAGGTDWGAASEAMCVTPFSTSSREGQGALGFGNTLSSICSSLHEPIPANVYTAWLSAPRRALRFMETPASWPIVSKQGSSCRTSAALLFVYGTLKPGFTNHLRILRHVAHGIDVAGEAVAPGYRLRMTPRNSPQMLDAKGTGLPFSVRGTLATVPCAALEDLDAFEGKHMERRPVRVHHRPSNLVLWAFAYMPRRGVAEEGEWMEPAPGDKGRMAEQWYTLEDDGRYIARGLPAC